MDMDSFKNSVAFWTTVVGTFAGLFGIIQSRAWLAIIGAGAVTASIGTFSYAKRKGELLESAALKIAGLNIDSLNLANLRRRLNRSLVIQQAENVAVIDGKDLTTLWKCAGYCRAERETAIEFSIDADANIPFAELDCTAFDLRRDPKRCHGIRPMLVGPDGMSKKIAVPFLAPLSSQEPFNILLRSRFAGCMKPGIDYYTTTLSFDQKHIERYSMRLTFRQNLPQWVRVYECDAHGDLKLLKALQVLRQTNETAEYLDTCQQIAARSARIYLFLREPASSRAGAAAAEAA
ncbi:MAG TPA: hypothetical protein VLT36_17290 [Candidatus Dormibacteraeota bacterium]|nr:hypothetical protein [Candidatus Dormibacteraeota bacterium]